MEINLGGMAIKQLSTQSRRISMLLWGSPGVGKTVFACSAPGKKLLILFDPDGAASLGNREDVLVLDLSAERNSIVDRFNSDDPFGLSKVLGDDELGITTVIVDSTTAYSQLAVEKGISITKGATLERPSPGAYGARNAITLKMMTSLLRLTNKYDKHIIFTSHEDEPTKDSEGNVMHITLQLGGKLGNQASLQISEVWHLADDGKQRKLMVRPGRMRKPMKTRMFDTSDGFEFVLRYKQSDGAGGEHSIASLFDLWEKSGYNKIKLPK
jgi:hypothetical protein